MLIRRGKSGLRCLTFCHRDPTPDKQQKNRWIGGGFNHILRWNQLSSVLHGSGRSLSYDVSFSFWKISQCRSGSGFMDEFQTFGPVQTLSADVMMGRSKDTECFCNNTGAVCWAASLLLVVSSCFQSESLWGKGIHLHVLTVFGLVHKVQDVSEPTDWKHHCASPAKVCRTYGLWIEFSKGQVCC